MANSETVQLRHAPTADCDGTAAYRVRVNRETGRPVAVRVGECAGCGVTLCWCETAYGHDCEG